MLDESFLAVKSRLLEIKERIRRAELREGREEGSVELIAVSKAQQAQGIAEAILAGHFAFGENYVQEALEKRGLFLSDPRIELHFIGHLQRNKVKALLQVPWPRLVIHGLDSERIIDELGNRARALGTRVEVLIQVNLGGEPQKSGCTLSALPALIDRVRTFPELILRGLMTIPPWNPDPEQSRPHFAQLRSLRDQFLGPNAWLSMGMSHDFEVAIAEGATHVRIGRAIFGERGKSEQA
ncbi:MAG: YggS family pyridoxal phosphate-dependent enzyme [Sandaracinaceae bacterium]|nr:YggS family pyridoxal phosphate-dependent enzyme [Sandaracinaceae bacterium]MDW8246024.1 YggS family pyridoxal phosphate-dependent enzyme [Sandaracinaceae bacterium]